MFFSSVDLGVLWGLSFKAMSLDGFILTWGILACPSEVVFSLVCLFRCELQLLIFVLRQQWGGENRQGPDGQSRVGLFLCPGKMKRFPRNSPMDYSRVTLWSIWL